MFFAEALATTYHNLSIYLQKVMFNLNTKQKSIGFQMFIPIKMTFWRC